MYLGEKVTLTTVFKQANPIFWVNCKFGIIQDLQGKFGLCIHLNLVSETQ